MKKHVIIIGTGIAGLNSALHIDSDIDVTIMTKKKSATTATNLAQGGIAGVLSATDDIATHITDTIDAGCGYNTYSAVKYMVENSTSAIYDLLKNGVRFETDGSKLLLTKEGGHTKNRIAYHKDYTGHEIERALIQKIKTSKNIKILQNTTVVEIIARKNELNGLTYLHNKKINYLPCTHLIIATGGMGQVYKYTTNPKVSTGDGFALAQELNLKMKDMEFIQFHPTAFVDNSKSHLLSEALRGEGARIIDEQGTRFLLKIDPRGELAPRDIVARAIFKHQKSHSIYLDMRHIDRKKINTHFPTIEKFLKTHGLSLKTSLIPITPVAHFVCGGIVTNLSGETSLPNIYAVGEVACTGVHGANRLASNSLLEAAVFSASCANAINKSNSIRIRKIAKFHPKLRYTYAKSTQIRQLNNIQKSIKETMWKYAGIVRTHKNMKSGLAQLTTIEKNFHKNFKPTTLNEKILETRNMIITSKLILTSALKRKKSLGTHYVEMD